MPSSPRAEIEPSRRLPGGGEARTAVRRAGSWTLPLFVGFACANEGPPPGAFPDVSPPGIAEIVPAPDTVVPGFDGSVKVRFDEPVTLGGNFGRQLLSSPAELYDVKTGFSEVKIRPKNGWRDGVVYCFELPSGIADLMRNRTESPIEFCFSTGPEVTSTLVNGRLEDRLTGQPVRGGRVLFLGPQEDSVRYSAVSDNEGEFRLRALPPGDYWAFGFEDRNRSLDLDRKLEPYDSATVALPGRTSTVTLDLSIVEPDSTAPLLIGAEVVDSLTLKLLFDDPLPRDQEGAAVTVSDSASGAEVAIVSVNVGEPTETAPSPAPADSAAAGAAPDSLGAAPEPMPALPDTSGVLADLAAGPLPEAPRGPGPSRTVASERPSQTVTLRLAEPLWPATFRIATQGFRNLRELTGGGETTVLYAPPEPQDSTNVERPPGRNDGP